MSRALVVLAVSSSLAACSSCEEPRAEPEAPAPAPPEVLDASSFRLANGLDVELVSGPCGETAAIAVLFAVGADHDPPGRSGMAELAGRLLPASDHARVEVGRDHTLRSMPVDRDVILEALDDVATILARFEPTEERLLGARAMQLEVVARQRGGDADATARSFAAESVLPTRGDGWRGGVAAELEAIELAEVTAFARAHLTPSNARLVVVGRFDPAEVRARIESALGSLPAGTAPVAREPTTSTVTGTLVIGDAPSAITIAVRAPSPSDAPYPAFLALAARLTADAEGRAWEARYDPIAEPALLFVSGPLEPAEHPDAASARVRREVDALLAPALAPADVEAARERFALFLGVDALDPATCTADPGALAIARARRAQLGLDGASIAEALTQITEEQRAEAVASFGARRTAAVVAGGTIR